MIVVMAIFENINPSGKSTAIVEILIMLFGAALLGYLLHRLIYARPRSLDAYLSTPKPEKPQYSKRKSNKVDDLKKIEGIGPKIEMLLNNAGIFSFEQLEEASNSEIKEILAAAGGRLAVHDTSTWNQQAMLANTGKWRDLKKLQKQIITERNTPKY